MLIPELKVRQANVYYVDYKDLEDYIKAIYGVEYNIVAGQELHNDCVVPVQADQPLSSGEIVRFRNWFKGEFEYYLLDVILRDLVTSQLIRPGQYFVEVSW